MFRATDTYDVTNHMQGNLCFNKCPIVADTPFPGAVVVVVGGRGGGGGEGGRMRLKAATKQIVMNVISKVKW